MSLPAVGYLGVVSFVTAWANAPFAIAAGIAGVFALLQVTGILGVIAGGGDSGDADADHDVDVEHDVDADADHDVEGEHDGDGQQASHGLGAMAHGALAPLGFGKIPFSIIWQTFALAFAAVGFAINMRYFDAESVPLRSLAWTLPAALFGGYVGVALVARVLGPVLSSKEQEATSRTQLVGQTGVVISTKVDKEFGEVRIRDKSGHDIRLVCKLSSGAKSVPREHQQVVVVECEENGELFVEPLDYDVDEVEPVEEAKAQERLH